MHSINFATLTTQLISTEQLENADGNSKEYELSFSKFAAVWHGRAFYL